MVTERHYRSRIRPEGLTVFEVAVEHTDLSICATDDYSGFVIATVEALREQLKQYIGEHPEFARALAPVPVPDGAADIVKAMAAAAQATGVGPMAAVAGAIAEAVGRELMKKSGQVIVENGGDIFVASDIDRTIGIYAGTSPLSDKIGIRVTPEITPLGICTSAGTVGPSLSFGIADAVTVMSSSTALADAAATALGNLVKDDDLDPVLKAAQTIPGLAGVVVIKEEKLGVWGNISLVSIHE